jgi:hypothetical protein
MLAAVYGLQVSTSLNQENQFTMSFPGSYLHHQKRVHACWMDGGLPHFVG